MTIGLSREFITPKKKSILECVDPVPSRRDTECLQRFNDREGLVRETEERLVRRLNLEYRTLIPWVMRKDNVSKCLNAGGGTYGREEVRNFQNGKGRDTTERL